MGTLEFCKKHHVINCLECFQNPIVDDPREVIEQKMKRAIENGWTAFIKYTCPGCGRRVVSKEPNVIRERYLHDECGTVAKPSGFGLLLAKRIDGTD